MTASGTRRVEAWALPSPAQTCYKPIRPFLQEIQRERIQEWGVVMAEAENLSINGIPNPLLFERVWEVVFFRRGKSDHTILLNRGL